MLAVGDTSRSTEPRDQLAARTDTSIGLQSSSSAPLPIRTCGRSVDTAPVRFPTVPGVQSRHPRLRSPVGADQRAQLTTLPRVPRLSWALADRLQDLWNRGAGCPPASSPAADGLRVGASRRRTACRCPFLRFGRPQRVGIRLGRPRGGPRSRWRRLGVPARCGVYSLGGGRIGASPDARRHCRAIIATLPFNDGSALLRLPSMTRSTIRCASCSPPRVSPTMVGGTLAASPFPARSGRPR